MTSLTAAERQRMYALMAAHYEAVSEAQFCADLAWKQAVGLLRDRAGELQGFSTLALNPRGCPAAGGHLLFSGDTIIHQAHWGTQALVRGFCETAGRLHATWPAQRLLWYLLSKGHRTYLYLPLFFGRYYPAAEPARHEAALAPVAAAVSAHLFGAAWVPARGVLAFGQSQGELKPALAAATWERRTREQVAFFLQRNPRFAQGEELVCLAELSANNLRGQAHAAFERGLAQPLSLAEQRWWQP